MFFTLFLSFLKAEEDSLIFSGTQELQISFNSNTHHYYLRDCLLNQFQESALFFQSSTTLFSDYYLSIYWSTISECKAVQGGAIYLDNIPFNLDFDCFCIYKCGTYDDQRADGGIIHSNIYTQKTENNIFNLMTITSGSSSRKCIHFLEPQNSNLETIISNTNFSNCLSTGFGDHVFSFVYTKKTFKFVTFEKNTLENTRGYMMSLNDTNSAQVDLIESCNFIDDTAPEAILLARNEFLDIKKTIIQRYNGHFIDCDVGFHVNIDDCVIDNLELIYWTDDHVTINTPTQSSNYPTYGFTFYATLNCYAGITVPQITPYETPYTTPLTTPYETPFTTPLTTPYETPYKTPFTTPDETPYETPFTTPLTTPIETPELTPQITVTPYQTPLITPYKTPSTTISEEPSLPDEDPTKQTLPDEDPTLTSTNEESSTKDNELINDGDNPSNDEGGSKSTIYIVIGCVCAVLVIIAAVILFIIYKRKHQQEETAETSDNSDEKAVEYTTNDNNSDDDVIFTMDETTDPFGDDISDEDYYKKDFNVEI